jgi:hemerythrin-like domain-containing protein
LPEFPISEVIMKGRHADATNRRELLAAAPWILGAALAPTVPLLGAEGKKGESDEDIAPAEDLMREHGALNRILLLYDDALAKIGAKKDFPPEVLASAASIIRKFIEDYHEKLEEDYLFPRFEKAGKLVDLVGVLKQQHAAGRTLTRQIEAGATLANLRNSAERAKTLRALRLFVRMYRPHEAREDTVLFPLLHSIVSLNDYETLGDQFEAKERELFGSDGFEKIVEEIAGLEKKVGVYDLAQFTPAG